MSGSRLRIEGCVIVSADGMLADANHEMPSSLKFSGDQKWFETLLDGADLIVHGKNSFEDQPRSHLRQRIIATRSVTALAADPSNPKATLWNPAGASFSAACEQAGVTTGTAVVIGGPDIFRAFLDGYDTFWLSQAPHVHIPNGLPAFGIGDQTPEDILASHRLEPTDRRMLDAAHDVTLTAWRREA
jgi:dihydrofolate reductase